MPPPVTYPPSLPISSRVDDIKQAIGQHQVVVVAGETGSGKSTQLPKICLDLGRGVKAQIAHTQPRRLAARTVADRIAAELEVELGGAVGYEVRFDRRSGRNTSIAVVTDGILLAGIQSDPLLQAYDTVIIDEAHERSLNIDFLLGYCARLLRRRRDLKLIITSATIDPERFSRHFAGAPVIEVSGRTYPVEVRYRPLDPGAASPPRAESRDASQPGGPPPGASTEVRDQTQAICDAVAELSAEGPGDILVFLSGEREIRDAIDALGQMYPQDELLPLYARLSTAQQHRVFAPHTGRRIVLATNIAETSLTVPGIRYVIDTGNARMSRYSARSKVQRLPIEKISQASADQRKGRCGRLADGICIRLYAEDDFLARPRFTEPEILRTNLASVLLQMAALGLGEVRDFPFLDPPDPRQVRDGLQLLQELGAVPSAKRPGARGRASRGRRTASASAPEALTPVGRTLARLPVDPRLGRMIVEADRNGCLDEVLVITAALSIPDPRLRPPEAREAADRAHARFADDSSDFLSVLNLWRYLREQQHALSSNQFRRLCVAEYLHHLRIREWQDLYAQLRRVARDQGMRRGSTPAADEAVHQSLLAGLLSHVGVRDGDRAQYRGARGTRFAIQPGSALFHRSPQWVMAAELVETTRLWARTVARIDPGWVERVAGHLVTRSYDAPHWDAGRGSAVAYEKVTLYGLPLVASRKVGYGRVDPQAARELFIRCALVEGEWHTSHRFWHDNQRRLAEAAQAEHKLRRRDVTAGDDILYAFYDARVPDGIVSTRHFDRWWKQAASDDPDRLHLPPALLIGDAGSDIEQRFPDHWPNIEPPLRVSYLFDPGSPDDGVTVRVPVTVVDRLSPEPFEWQVPGLRRELVTELLRSLPKEFRRRFVPVTDFAEAALSGLTPADGSLLAALEEVVKQRVGVSVPRTAWRPERLPEHLKVKFRVEDPTGSPVAGGTDLLALRHFLAPQVHAALSDAAGHVEQRGLTAWTFGRLPRQFTGTHGGVPVVGFPALVDEGQSVAIRVLPTEAEQRAAMWSGTRRLLRLNVGSPIAQVHRRLGNTTKLALTSNPHGSVAALMEDAVTAALDELLARHGGPVWEVEHFAALLTAVRADLVDTLVDLLETVAGVLELSAQAAQRLDAVERSVPQPAVADIRAQLDGLVHAGFIRAKSPRRLNDVARYLEAVQRRLDALPRDPHRDRQRMERVHQVQRAYLDLRDRLPPRQRASADVQEIAWMIEELRVSEFAQAVGTAYRVSVERVLRAIETCSAEARPSG